MLENPNLKPKPKWSKELQEKIATESLNSRTNKPKFPKALAVIRPEINSLEYDEKAYNSNYPELSAEELFLQSLRKTENYDQIVNLDSTGEILERKNLKYLNFLQELNVQDRIRHETIHPLVFDLTKEIFGEIKDMFDYRVELVVGSFDIFLKMDLKDLGIPIAFYAEKCNKTAFFYKIFQFALASAIKDSFWDKPNAKENQQKLYDSLNKLIQKVNQTRKENSQNDQPNQDIILDYTECLSFLPKITKQDVINKINIFIKIITDEKKTYFTPEEGFNFDDFEIWLQNLDGEKLIDCINKD
jgi:hypothetical protein